MSFNKKFFTTGGIVASTPPAAAAFDPLQNFETVTYTGNGSTQKITGYIRKGGAFNGTTSQIRTVGNPIPSTSSLFSISFWFQLDNTNTNNHIFSIFDNVAGTNKLLIRSLTGGDFQIGVYGTSGSNFISTNSSTFPYTTGVWYHLVYISRSDGNNEFWINGTQIATSSGVAANTTSSSVPITMGGRGDLSASTTERFGGKLDQVRIFNRALLEDNNGVNEIQALADETYADPKKSTTDYFGDGSGVALYELDEDANDTGVPIDNGQSAVFNGSSSYVLAPSFMPTGSNPRSVSAWVKTTVSNANMTILMYGAGSNNNFFIFRIANGQLGIAFYANDHDFTATGLTDGNWHHVVGTYDGSLAKVYLDGNLIGTGSAGAVSTNSSNLGIGAYNNGVDALFNGSMDQVRIYSSALSSGDVTNLYNESSVPTANLVAHYKLDGNGNDETTNYNATSVNNVTYSDPAAIAYNGTPTNVNFLGMAFQPDLVWVKRRDSGIGGTNHLLFDSVRGAGERLSSDNANQEYTLTDEVTSFDSNGFTVGADASTNGSGGSIVAWCWKAGGNSNTFNVDGIGYSDASAAGLATGTNNPTGASVNTKSGFSIIKLNSGSVANSDRTVAHGLGVKPSFVLFRRTSPSAWFTWSAGLSPESYYLYLQDSYGVNDLTQSSNAWGNQSFTDTTISWRNSWTFSPNEELIAYVWADIPGYQKSGSYTGTGLAGKIVYTDSNGDGTGTGAFKPRFVIIKNATTGNTSWAILDTDRDDETSNNNALFANLNIAEWGANNTTINVDFTDTGFTIQNNYVLVNAVNDTYIYLAIA